MAISKLRITAGQLLPRVHSAAKSSSNVSFIPPPNKRSLGGMMHFLQALKCLQEGQIVGKPRLNEHGDWEFEMERFAANHWTKYRVVARAAGASVTHLFVFLET